MRPQSNAADQAQWPKIQVNPIGSWSSQPANSCTTWPHQINQKKVTTPERHVLKPDPCNVAMPEAGQSLDQGWKGGFHGCEKRKKAKPGTAASCSTNDKQQGEQSKNGQLFHFT